MLLCAFVLFYLLFTYLQFSDPLCLPDCAIFAPHGVLAQNSLANKTASFRLKLAAMHTMNREKSPSAFYYHLPCHQPFYTW